MFSGCDQKDVPPFMKLFWDKQQKYLRSSTYRSVCYHPMIIKFCFSLAAKSPLAYFDLRYDGKNDSGMLPSLSTLRDNKHYTRPKRCIISEVINEISEKNPLFSAPERFVTILFDEMKIQDDLVLDKHTGESIDFVDLGDIKPNYVTLEDVTELVTHVLVFLVKRIVNPLSYFKGRNFREWKNSRNFWKKLSRISRISRIS